MPIYEYLCEECKTSFDVLTKLSEKDKTQYCPECGSEKVKKVFSSFSVGSCFGRASSHNHSCQGG